ncbi:MAG: NAD(P)-dependent oxidoreductase [Halodesulfurarchaeum sp.]
MERVGFIGLGSMGAPMAWNVNDGGFDLGVYNRTPEKMDPFAEAGIDTYESPGAVATSADAVVTMVRGPAALREVVLGDDGIIETLEEDAVVVDTSTVSRTATMEVSDAVEDAGGRYVDAPVLGTVGPAEAGELLVLAGADDAVLAETRSLLEVFGDVRHVGSVGDGSSMKLTTNLLLGVMMEGFSEALAFADGQDLPLETVLDVIQNGVLGAPLFEYKGEVVRNRDFDPQFPVSLLGKDLDLVLDAAGEDPLPLPATAASREATSATKALGYGDEDMMALLKYLEGMTGEDIGTE